MISDRLFFEKSIQEAMPFAPTEAQLRAIHALAMLTYTRKPQPTLIINGFAGTGKTALMNAFCTAMMKIGADVVLMAPTGRAAKVLSGATGRSASTIHRTIYRQAAGGDGASYDTQGDTRTDLTNKTFNLSGNNRANAVFVVDEASMIGNERGMGLSAEGALWGQGRLLEDLIGFVFSQPGNKLVLIGDPDQLPPVGLAHSLALDKTYLESMGLTVGRVWLTDIVRQEEDSLILQNATKLRDLIDNEVAITSLPEIITIEGSDVEELTGENVIEKLESAFDEFGTQDTVVITRSNKRATMYSMGIRSKILYMEELLVKGDLLVVTKNNYLWSEKANTSFIANGDIVEVVSINGYSEMYGLHFADVSVRLIDRNDIDIDCKILLDLLTADVPVMDEYSHTQQTTSSAEILNKLQKGLEEDYEQSARRSTKRSRDFFKYDEWFNALQVRYAYSFTCHKAQGGQWSAVFVDIGYVTDEMLDTLFVRWLYTAVSRARKKLYFVNYKKQ
ncbi:MAG: AAA family ATPase [Bacteroidales bacterium]|nr:AAA family ATPase [Bacteroidales bacterium]